MIDFDRWAKTYDDTRGASPSVLRPLRHALGAPHGRSLLDIGGGTGNFAAPLAAAGFAVTLSDLSPAMTRRAAEKLTGARVVAADAQRLPFRDASFDCAISVNVLRHVPDRALALREARRVLRGGPLVVKVSVAETMRANWLQRYIPQLMSHQPPYKTEAQIAEEIAAAGFSDVATRRFVYEDAVDGSFQAIKHVPELLLRDDVALNTAVLQRVPRDELRAALQAIRRDHASGRLREIIDEYAPLLREYGDGTFFVATV